MPTTQREHIQRLIDAMQARLRELEVDAAQLGYSAPPHIATEISEINAEITKQQAALQALELVDTLNDASIGVRTLDRRDTSNYEHRLNVMVATVMATVSEVATVKKHVDDSIDALRLLIWRIVVGAGVLFIIWWLGLLAVIYR